MRAIAKAGSAGRRHRPALSREQIIDTAIELIEREGDPGASMRRVAAELGVAAMSLYNHIPNKSALVEGVASRIVRELDGDAGDPSLPWMERARVFMRAYHDLARRYPRCVSFFLRHSGETADSLRPIERALALAADAGFEGEQAVAIMRALLAYAIGAQFRESGGFRAASVGASASAEALDPVSFPRLTQALPYLADSDPDRDFDFGLDLLLNAIEALPRHPSSGRTATAIL